MTRSTIAVLHYTAPPVSGGVESVIKAHARLFLQAGFEVIVIAGRGAADALAEGVQFQLIPEVDSLHPRVAALSAALEQGCVPADFDTLATGLAQALAPVLSRCDHVIVHNVFTKHFNLPLTAALFDLLDAHALRQCIAWCHDFTWTSAHSRSKVHPGYPWDLLCTWRSDVNYVVVSRERQHTLAQLFKCPPAMIHVIYNGVDPDVLLGLSANGRALIDRLGFRDGDLIILMPVRITTAKNIELALQVTAVLKARGCQPRLIVTGPPDPHDRDSLAYFQSLQKLRKQLDVESNARFVFESGSDSEQSYVVDEQLVAELFRVSDVLFMPSRREGFGMPILEAGLIGKPVFCSNSIPAAQEIGGEDVVRFDANDSPEFITDLIQAWVQRSPAQRLRRRIKQDYSWPAIFRREIAPLLTNGGDAVIHSSDQIMADLLNRDRLWLFLDYDGTLADFAPTPADIFTEPEVVRLVTRLTRCPRVRIAVISGRTLSQLQQLLPVPNVLLAGTYGVELQTFDGEISQRAERSVIRPALEQLKLIWQQLITARTGFFIEDKGWALALHARFANAREADRVLADAGTSTLRLASFGEFRVLQGQRFLEVAPAIAHKGRTVDYLLDQFAWPGALPVYLGDDDKDEDAFAAIQRPTRADARLVSPQAARTWLDQLVEHLNAKEMT